MVAACRTALTRAGGEGPTGGGYWRDSEYADGQMAERLGSLGGERGLGFTGGAPECQRRLRRVGVGGVLDMGKRWAEAPVSKTRCLGS